jgi:hypothetical protein
LKRNFFILIALFSFLLTMITSCKEDTINVDPQFRLAFSADTLRFDTLFTDLVSPTLKLKVYNHSDRQAYIEQIRLMDGKYYHLNINGLKVDEARDIYLQAKDSMLIFVQVEIASSQQELPFALRDSILFALNGTQQVVQLEAFGQNSHRINGLTLLSDTTFTAQMPYLISDTLRVAKGATLTLEPGTRLYFRKYAVLYVEGTLLAQGSQELPVQLRGDRNDYMNTIPPLSYDLCSGQWGGIVLATGSMGNQLIHTDVRNGDFGIRIDSTTLQETVLTVKHAQLRNVTGNLLQATHAKVEVLNSLLYNAGGYVVALHGGHYTWKHCTFANYYQFSWGGRTVPILLYNNTNTREDGSVTSMPFTSQMYNSVVYGSYTNEIQYQLDTLQQCDYVFSHCLLRLKLKEIPNPPYQDCVFGADAHYVFKQWEEEKPHVYDFHITSGSGAIGIGDNQIAHELPYDLDGNSRLTDGSCDAGCYEFIE